MKNILLPIAGVMLFIVFVGFLTKKAEGTQRSTPTAVSKVALKEMTIGKTKIMVEIADSNEERAKGLSGRSQLAQDTGLLFVFDQKGTFPSFWMKDMEISIDIIWIKDGKVAKIDKNVPLPVAGTADRNLPLYRPDKPIDYVLEVNAGFSEKNKIVVGDSVKSELF